MGMAFGAFDFGLAWLCHGTGDTGILLIKLNGKFNSKALTSC
jgi:hypothetical protein